MAFLEPEVGDLMGKYGTRTSFRVCVLLHLFSESYKLCRFSVLVPFATGVLFNKRF